jgi:hypothetical protein
LGKRKRHFDIKYFYVTDLVGRNEVKIEYCSTDEIIADYNTKPVVGSKFALFCDRIMNLSGKHHHIGHSRSVLDERKINGKLNLWILSKRSQMSHR